MNKTSLKKYLTEDMIEIGVDEAGRGPLFGRVYTAAVILPKDDTFDHSMMKDSKRFTSKKKIKEASEYIKQNAIAYSITYSDEKQIDNTNILKATMDSMHRSINEIIKDESNTHLLIDGNYFNAIYYADDEGMVPVKYTCVEKGDNTFTSIAAASILAKFSRDSYIEELCEKNPELADKYGINTNMGYGAKKHMDGIKLYGATEWHRMSFAPFKNKRCEKIDK
jgi:ribonuclease HII